MEKARKNPIRAGKNPRNKLWRGDRARLKAPRAPYRGRRRGWGRGRCIRSSHHSPSTMKVAVLALRQLEGGGPDAVRVLFHHHSPLLPFREITHEHHARRRWRDVAECLHFWFLRSSAHWSLSFRASGYVIPGRISAGGRSPPWFLGPGPVRHETGLISTAANEASLCAARASTGKTALAEAAAHTYKGCWKL